MSTISTIEAAIAEQLAPLASATLPVVRFSQPANGSSGQRPPGDRIVVAYQRSRWGPVLTNVFEPVIQERTFTFAVGIMAADAKAPRTLENPSRAAQDIQDSVVGLLVGFRPDLSDDPNHSLLYAMSAVADSIADPSLLKGMWLLSSLFAVPTRFYQS